MPDYTRSMTFRCSVRDNVAGGGAFNDDQMSFTVYGNSGPFVVNSPGNILQGNSEVELTWDVAGTDVNPIYCSDVQILMSTNGGYDFDVVLLESTPNSGSATITLPNIDSNLVRFKVKAIGNIFFDITNVSSVIVFNEGPDCPGDVNGNGAIEVGDVLQLSEFGCTSQCTADVDGDGQVTVSDILTLISHKSASKIISIFFRLDSQMEILMSLVGMVVLLGIAVLLSKDRKAINLRTVGGAFALQFLIGAIVLYTANGKAILESMSNAVKQVIDYGDEATGFIFGSLADPGSSIGWIFAVKVLPIIVYFSALISVLYYTGIMKWVINILGGGISKLLGTSRSESLSATANIFVGQTEAPLVVRPFIKSMTKSELFAVMYGGLASIAGSVLAALDSMNVPMEYLIAASFMAAPGGLLFAKIIMPETEEPVSNIENLEAEDKGEKPANILDAAATGAASGLKLALNVGAMLLAFVGLIALINGVFGGVGSWFGYPDVTLELLLGYVFSPLAFLIGVPWDEAISVGSFIGQN